MKSAVAKSSVSLFLRTRQSAQHNEARLYHWERDKGGENLDATHWNRALRCLCPAQSGPPLRLKIGV